MPITCPLAACYDRWRSMAANAQFNDRLCNAEHPRLFAFAFGGWHLVGIWQPTSMACWQAAIVSNRCFRAEACSCGGTIRSGSADCLVRCGTTERRKRASTTDLSGRGSLITREREGAMRSGKSWCWRLEQAASSRRPSSSSSTSLHRHFGWRGLRRLTSPCRATSARDGLRWLTGGAPTPGDLFSVFCWRRGGRRRRLILVHAVASERHPVISIVAVVADDVWSISTGVVDEQATVRWQKRHRHFAGYARWWPSLSQLNSGLAGRMLDETPPVKFVTSWLSCTDFTINLPTATRHAVRPGCVRQYPRRSPENDHQANAPESGCCLLHLQSRTFLPAGAGLHRLGIDRDGE